MIEHVGGPEKQAAFSREVHRLADAYWVQTPSSRFPLEVHTGMPLYWQWPEFARRWINRRWQRNLPAFQRMIAGTTVLTRHRMAELFPDGSVFIERIGFFEKSYAFYKPFVPNTSADDASNMIRSGTRQGSAAVQA